MYRLAYIINNVVDSVIISNSILEGPYVDVTSLSVGPGFTYNNGIFEAPVQQTYIPPELPDTSNLIDIGPFFDRFDHYTPGTKLAVLSSTDVVVQAIIKDVQSRKWVTLNRPDVSVAIDILIGKGINGVDSTLKNYIINTPVSAEENLALRKVYFS